MRGCFLFGFFRVRMTAWRLEAGEDGLLLQFEDEFEV
jgi:hypothetical protein